MGRRIAFPFDYINEICPRANFYLNLSPQAKDFTRTKCGFHLATARFHISPAAKYFTAKPDGIHEPISARIICAKLMCCDGAQILGVAEQHLEVRIHTDLKR